jgi:hypothetical protein
MADMSVVAKEVRPLNGAIVRRFTAGGTVAAGQAVYIAADGDVELADADDQTQVQARGIVVGVGVEGQTSAGAGQVVDVVTHGPIALGATGLTDGGAVYISTNAGGLDQTGPSAQGKFRFVIGWAESDSTIYVNPQVLVPSANP